jgi:hypothetical protein
MRESWRGGPIRAAETASAARPQDKSRADEIAII